MVPTGRLAVVTVGGADRVSIVPPKFAPEPTTSQFAGPAQNTPDSDPTPEGATWLVQFTPPSAVTRMLFPPTAVQLLELMQLTEDSGVVPTGLPRSFHCAPPSVVAITPDPVARQVVSLEQETPSRLATPSGIVCGVQVLPPLVVLRMAASGPREDEPTAVQLSESAQEMAVKSVTVDGIGSDVHIVPPSVVAMTLGESSPELKSLTARQVEALMHETAVSAPMPDGRAVSAAHVTPALVVPLLTGLPNMLNPTAVQSEVVGHEIPFSPLTSEGIVAALQA